MARSLSPKREERSPTVFKTVRSLGSALMIFSYSEMAFCSLPCWTNFSAELSTFCLLNPKPNAIEVRTPLMLLTRLSDYKPGDSEASSRSGHGKGTYPKDGPTDKANCTTGHAESYGY